MTDHLTNIPCEASTQWDDDSVKREDNTHHTQQTGGRGRAGGRRGGCTDRSTSHYLHRYIHRRWLHSCVFLARTWVQIFFSSSSAIGTYPSYSKRTTFFPAVPLEGKVNGAGGGGAEDGGGGKGKGVQQGLSRVTTRGRARRANKACHGGREPFFL